MKKQKIQNALYNAIVVSEVSHVFCCVLPTVFSVLSLLAGIGMVTAVPGWLEGVHALMHRWEIPLIILSGVVVGLGWALHWYSEKIDCHDHGCGHGPCEPKKNRAHNILKIATALFLVNVTIYIVFHRGMDGFATPIANEIHDTHDSHNH